MEELIKIIASKHNLSEEEAQSILMTISDHIKQKFPMVSGAVDNLFQTKSGHTTPKSGSDIQRDTYKDVTHTPDFLDI